MFILVRTLSVLFVDGGDKKAKKVGLLPTVLIYLFLFVCFGAKCVKLWSDRTKPRRKSDESTTITLKEMEIISLQLPLCTCFSLFRLFVMLMDFEVCTGQSVTKHLVINLFPGIEQLRYLYRWRKQHFGLLKLIFFFCHNFH